VEGNRIELVRPPSLVDVVTETIRNCVFSGELSPGDPLPAIPLSKSFGVSRGTVREALKQLQDENLVDIYPHRGVYVATLTPVQLEEVYSLRALIEPYAARLAIERKTIDESLIKNLVALVRKMAQAERCQEHLANIEADFEFHLTICKASCHNLLINVEEGLRSMSYLAVLNMIIYESEPVDTEEEHMEILDALRRRDPATAPDALKQHLEDSKSWLLERWKKLGQPKAKADRA